MNVLLSHSECNRANTRILKINYYNTVAVKVIVTPAIVITAVSAVCLPNSNLIFVMKNSKNLSIKYFCNFLQVKIYY